MLLFIYNNDNMTWFFIWMLIRFSMEYVFFTVWCTFINNTFKYFLLFHNFLSIAVFALVFLGYLLSCSIAISTWTCRLGVHAWTKHSHLSSHSSSSASRTSRFSSVLSTFTITNGTDSISVYSNFGSLTLIDFFKSNFNRMLYALSLCWALLSSASSSTEHL